MCEHGEFVTVWPFWTVQVQVVCKLMYSVQLAADNLVVCSILCRTFDENVVVVISKEDETTFKVGILRFPTTQELG